MTYKKIFPYLIRSGENNERKQSMKKVYIMIFTLLLSTVYLYSENNFEGELAADIDHDGKLEMVQWNKFATTEAGNYYQLRVIGDNGEIIWEGPRDKNGENPFVPAVLDFGISIPELLADYDLDGNMELLMPELQSDISPTIYRRLRWNGNGFVLLRPAFLMATNKNMESFTWEKSPKTNGIWVSLFNGDGVQRSSGNIEVDIMMYDGGTNAKQAKALIKFDRTGAYVVKWIKKFRNSNSTEKGVMVKSDVPAKALQWSKVKSARLEDLSLEVPTDWLDYRDDDTWEIKDKSGRVIALFEIGLQEYDKQVRLEMTEEFSEMCEILQTKTLRSHGHEVFSLLCKARKELNEQNIYAVGMQVFLTPSIGTLKESIYKKLVLKISMKDFSKMQWIIDHIVQSVHFADEGADVPSGKASSQSSVVTNYVARLSRKDHVNSRGTVLSSVSDILRQDRVNFYNGRGNREDTEESFFKTLNSRSKMSKYTIVPIGRTYTSMKKIILHRTPVVKVEVRQSKLYVEIIKY